MNVTDLTLRKGIPYGWKWLEVYCLDKAGGYIYEVVPKKNEHKRTVYDEHRKKVMIKRKKRQDVVLLKWFPILAPIKFLTVLYHEVRPRVRSQLTYRSVMRLSDG
jgi:hypothetical protein